MIKWPIRSSFFETRGQSCAILASSGAISVAARPRHSQQKAQTPRIDADKIREAVKYLSSDELEGRGTGQKGGDVAADYIAAQFKSYGLKPAGDNGTYFQNVPMVGVKTMPSTTFTLVPAEGHSCSAEESRRLRHQQRNANRYGRHRRTDRLRWVTASTRPKRIGTTTRATT